MLGQYLYTAAMSISADRESLFNEVYDEEHSPALKAVYNNLQMALAPNTAAQPQAAYEAGGDEKLKLAMRIDEAVRRVRPDGWRGVQPREQVIKAELYKILKNESEVERLFLVIKARAEY